MAFIRTFIARCDHCGENEITVKGMSEQQANDNIITRGWSLVGGHACIACQIKNPALKKHYMVEPGLTPNHTICETNNYAKCECLKQTGHKTN